MKSPFTGNEMKVHVEPRLMNFRKEEFRIQFHVYRCEDTGEQFENEDLSELNYNQAVNQYRAKYHLLFPEEIKAIREQYGLSAPKMAKILGLGDNSYRNYENGEVPSQANSNLIKLAAIPTDFKRFVVNNDVCLEDKERVKLLAKLDALIIEQERKRAEFDFEQYVFGKTMPSVFTGYRKPNLAKIREMIVYFTEKMEPFKTKINKLLFYADFSMFYQKGVSISGVQYQAIQMGPVPKKYETIYDYLANNNDIDIHETLFDNGAVGYQFKPNSNRKFNPDLFTEDELAVLSQIEKRFKNCSTNEIIELSHQEDAWLHNIGTKAMINYEYGFYLKSI